VGLLCAAVLAACSGASAAANQYRDPDGELVMTVPESWHIYDPGQVAALSTMPFVNQPNGVTLPAVRVAAFDGAPTADVGNVTKDLATVTFPIGATAIRTIGDQERDFVSRYLISQAVLPYYGYSHPSENLREDFSFGDGYDGVRRRITYTSSDGTTTGVAYFIAVTDPGDTQMFSVLAGCSLDCYSQNQTEIEQAVDSWLVNTKA
jgi:hypothetical protein